jgi:hypothetical protein
MPNEAKEISDVKQQTRARLRLAFVILVAVLTISACGGGAEKERKAAFQATTGEKTETTPPNDKVPKRFTGGDELCANGSRVRGAAVWAFQPKTFDELRGRASAIVLANVQAVQQAQNVVLPTPAQKGSAMARTLPIQRVTLKVLKTEKGTAKAGETLTLIKVGSDCFDVDDDPPYHPGEKHLLMVEQGPRGFVHTAAPEGRYKQRADGALDPIVDNNVTRQVRGKRLQDVEPQLRGQ